ncbi:BgTH12-02694 [Blumeria graminis f. sp. triticale]|uniref:Conserved oligomeric Golgi complex subunit 6 n=1 Tax=Blumeria graminis f. sp. triticale TaxID=1689686 RepID=A0A9W4D2L2_BLUGR|nr:BgTH12-02694 [Blumeria graminis f. sp. triticale]
MAANVIHNSHFDSNEDNENQTDGNAQGRSLASKITTVLSASYTDSDIRDAIHLLDKQNLKNTPATRRQLRHHIQKDLIESNGNLINEFGLVARQLKNIGSTIKNLNQICGEMKLQISKAHQETAPLLSEASALIKQKDEAETKQLFLAAFNSNFIISEEDIALLTLGTEPVDDEFFAVLARAKKIQKDCEILLGTENQRLGLEIMENISRDISNAFQKLYRWIQREFKSLNLENPQISSSIRRALRVLAERPSLFQNCLNYFSEAREKTLTGSFYTALSGTLDMNSRNDSIKPIELVAHDPIRYVGDMLAWTHSATVSEKEALEVLFKVDGEESVHGLQAGCNSELWNQIIQDKAEVYEFDEIRALNELVDRDLSGVASILRQRIGQVIQSHEETILAYRITNLLSFYRITFSKLLGDDSNLLESLSTLEESASKQFRMLMRENVSIIQTDTHAAPEDFGPPAFLYDGLKQLKTIMETYEASYTSLESREVDFQAILVDSFDPFIHGCEKISGSLQIPYNLIFLINCLLVARNTLMPFPFTQKKASSISKNIERVSAELIDHQHHYFRKNSGLKNLFEATENINLSGEDYKAITSLGPLQPDALARTSRTLDEFLPSALIDAIGNLSYLQSSVMAREVTEKAVEKFCSDFEKFEQTLSAIDERYGQAECDDDWKPLRANFPRTIGDVRVLLS